MMNKIKLIKVKIPRTEIAALSDKDKKRLVMFTAMLRDLNLLQKLLLYVGNAQSLTEVETDANETVVAFILKNLISRLYEMNIFLRRNGVNTDVSNQSQNLQDLKDKLQAINHVFSDKKTEKLFHFIRNKFGYHYEYEDNVDELLGKSVCGSDFEMWLSKETSTNEIFPTLDKAILNTIFFKMRELGFVGNDSELLHQLFELTVPTCKLFREFCTEYISKVFDPSIIEGETVELDVPSMSDVRLPFIVTV